MKEATLMQILDSREERAARQEALRAEFSVPVLSFTLNIAGPVKNSPLIARAFREGLSQLSCRIPEETILHRETKTAITGCEALFALDMDAGALKKICTEIEEAAPLGRLFDMDVINENGEKRSREHPRSCLICGAPGRGCAARRIHSAEQLQEKTRRILRDHFSEADALTIGAMAKESLLEEVRATPKPGLVDRRNNGSHRDMDIHTFEKSAGALETYFAQAVRIGQSTAALPPEQTFAQLRAEGIKAEQTMYRATGGVNTHKGLIYSMGILCGSLGRLWNPAGEAIVLDALLAGCAALTEKACREDFAQMTGRTSGERWYLEKGITGIRGEVAGGFPSLKTIALPHFLSARQGGKSREEAGISALLHLIARMDDTNLFHRGGENGALWAKEQTKKLLISPFPAKAAIEQLDDAFIDRNLSPGGAADLLALTFFVTGLGEAGYLFWENS